MRIVIAPDKFKGSLSAREAAEAMRAGFARAFPGARIDCIPLADGGEGLLGVFQEAAGGELRKVVVNDALGRPVEASFLLTCPDGVPTAVVESGEACGIRHIAPEDRDLPRSSTHGVGELMLAAAASGAERMLVGLGGSATNDAGLGMAQALGFRFTDGSGNTMRAVPELFSLIREIHPPASLHLPPVTAACDVRNPLAGPRGATRIYGPQKGMRAEDAEMLESAHRHVARLVGDFLGRELADVPGAGAAGGLGFGLLAFCNARLMPGFGCVSEVLRLGEKIRGASLVVTGEGGMDSQTLEGKTPFGVAEMARRHGVPVVAIAGNLADEERLAPHFDALASLVSGPMTMEAACSDGAGLLEAAAFRTGRALAVSLR